MKSVILQTIVSPIVVSIVLLLSVFLLLVGGRQPGGGFVAGLLTAAAIVLRLVAFGRTGLPRPVEPDGGGAPRGAAGRLEAPRMEAESREIPRLARFAGLGLALALATGLASLAVGLPFFTSAHGHVSLPLVGEIEYESALLFDVGIYAVVVGATLLIVDVFAEGE